MKILYITNNLNGQDGWSRYSLGIVKPLGQAEVLWLVANRSENTYEQEAILSEPLRYLFNIFLIFTTARKINLAIKKFSPDVIHFLVEPYLTVLPFLDPGKAKIVLTVHGTYSFLPNAARNLIGEIFLRWWARLAYSRVDKIVAVSGFTKDHLTACLNKHNFKGIREKITVITNGVDLSDFQADRGKREARVVKQILFVGAVKKRKGLAEAISALKAYQERYSKDFVFNIIGAYDAKDPYYLSLKSLVSLCQLDDKVIFKNKVDESTLRDFYAQADLFLMLPLSGGNNFEGFGLVYLEANAGGVPCIGTRHSGAVEAILDGQTGYLVETDLAKEVAEKIDLILNKQAISSEACVDWARQNDINIKIKELFKIYDLNK